MDQRGNCRYQWELHSINVLCAPVKGVLAGKLRKVSLAVGPNPTSSRNLALQAIDINDKVTKVGKSIVFERTSRSSWSLQEHVVS
jgi:hypothetical protein